MKTGLFAAVSLSLLAPVALPSAALAQPGYGWRGDDRHWDPSGSYREDRQYDRRMRRNDRIYRGGDGRYYCRRNNGTTGLVVGGVGGAVAGGVIGGGTLGTLIGAGAGALLGRAIDRGHVHCR